MLKKRVTMRIQAAFDITVKKKRTAENKIDVFLNQKIDD